MNFAALFLPVLFGAVFVFAAVRRVRVYDSFAEGAAGALPLLRSLFPYIAAVLVLSELFEASGLSARLCAALSPLLSAVGVPPEIAPLVLVKPFSGSGSLSLLSELYARYGADSYVARCASVAYASGETVFYLSAVYFAAAPGKKPFLPVLLALAANAASLALGCLFCRVL